MKQYRVIIPIVLLILGGCSKSTTSPETSTYTITPTAGLNGMINPSSATTVESGQSQRFVFMPDAGFIVDVLLIDGVKVDSSVGYTFINVNTNHTIRVTFKLASFTLTPSVGPHGSITPSNVVGVDYGGTQRFIFTPDANYQVDSVFVDGVEVDSLIGYSFVNVTASHSIRVVYSAIVAETWTYPSNGAKFAATVYSSASTVQNGSRFEVLVVYYNMTNVFGTAIELGFPTDKIAIRDVIAGPYISGSSALILKKLDNTAGRVSLGATFTAGSGSTAAGSGVILKLKCRAINTGSSPITINASKLQILQPDGSSITNFNTLQIENLTMGIQ
ncbi:MAG: cohesin domain-containing protein [Ignavibacteriales bacterium]|nr:cohesin domain-containing protein [Ignavibacteriales bacterium]